MNYIVAGSDEFLIEKQTSEIINKYLSDINEMNYSSFDASEVEWQSVIADASTLPFFSDNRVMIITNCNFLTSKGGLNTNDEKIVADYFDRPNSSTIVILQVQQKIDKRKKFNKKLLKLLRYFEISELNVQQFEAEIRNNIKECNLNISEEAIGFLLQILPVDLKNWQNEFKKLKLFPSAITIEVIRDIITRSINDDIFKIVDAVLKKDLETSLLILNDLLVNNNDPIAIISLLATNFRLIYQVKVYRDKNYNLNEITDFIKVHPYRIKLANEKARKISINKLLSVLNDLAILDYRYKNIACDRKMELEIFILKWVVQ